MIWVNGESIALDARFPDGTFALKVPYAESKAPYVFWTTIRWHYQDESEMAALFYLTKHIKQDKDAFVRLIMPYVPNARMDRVHHSNEVFTLKYFAEFINSLGFNTVHVFDPHSNVATALINNCKVLSPEPYIRRAMEDMNDPDLLLFYPDEGAMKRYSDMIKTPYGFGIKRRCWETGKITGLDVVCNADIKGKNVLIVDDICCRGGTFFHSAKALKEMGAKSVSVFCSHCEHAIFDGDLLTTDFVDHVYTTDSIFHKEHEKITVFPVEEGKEGKNEAQPASAM